jgi:hypothetical protein
MSGGAFGYFEYQMLDAANGIQNAVDDREHSDKAKIKMLEAVDMLRMAYVYAKAVDYYLSGDIGEDTLVSRIETELEKL